MSAPPSLGSIYLSGIKGILFACVGKPSAGKSTFLNAIAENAHAKVGNFPFTTIDPNRGIAFYSAPCPCKTFGVSEQCRPRYGTCRNGIRQIPVKVLDVAGLVPGAHEGRGLGNRFLDDLRSASVLVHVVDASGTTNEKGENTVGYNPTQDVRWLQEEIELWIFGNLMKNWTSVVRKHTVTRGRMDETLQTQLSGYGVKLPLVSATLSEMKLQEPYDKLEAWDEPFINGFVKKFVSVRFPAILALNKIDVKDADKNVARIIDEYGDSHVVLCSALAEVFLLKMRAKKFINYNEGDEDFQLKGESPKYSYPNDGSELIEAPPKYKEQLLKTRDMVLFRFGTTGCHEVITKVIERQGLIPVYPVASNTKFTSLDSQRGDDGVFRDVVLVPSGSTVRKVARTLALSMGVNGSMTYKAGEKLHRVVHATPITASDNAATKQQMGPGDLVTKDNNVLRLIFPGK